MQSDNGRLKQQSKRNHVVYPGISHPIESNKPKGQIAKVLSSSAVHRQIETTGRYLEKPASEGQPVNPKQIEDSFNLDWVDITSYSSVENNNRKDSITSGGTKYFGLSDYKLNSFGNSSITLKRSHSSTTIPAPGGKANLLITLSAKMQANQKLNNESTTLDLGNTELLAQSPDIYFDDQNLDGQLIDGTPEVKKGLSDEYNHLDEPIMDTLMRDLTGIYNKMKIIALPLSSYDIYKVVLRGWDLWGPLLLCTFLAFNLHHSESRDNHLGPHFADVFVLVWFGSCIVSLNYRLLSISSVNNRTITSQMNQTKASGVHQYESGGDSGNLKGTGENAKSFVTSHYDTPYQTLHSPPSTFQLMCVMGYCLVAPCFGLILLKIFSFDRLFFERIVIGLLFGFAWPTFCSVRILIRYQHPNKRALAIYPIGLFYFVLSCMIILNH